MSRQRNPPSPTRESLWQRQDFELEIAKLPQPFRDKIETWRFVWQEFMARLVEDICDNSSTDEVCAATVDMLVRFIREDIEAFEHYASTSLN